jgi:hypothetical protein
LVLPSHEPPSSCIKRLPIPQITLSNAICGFYLLGLSGPKSLVSLPAFDTPRRLSIGSAACFELYSPGLQHLAPIPQAATLAGRSVLPTLAICIECSPPAVSCLDPFPALPRFRQGEIPKPLAYPSRHFIDLPITWLMPGTGTAPYPDASHHPLGGMPLFHYTLELSRDPPRLRAVVPTSPHFCLRTCRITTTSPAQARGLRCTLARTPEQGFPPLCKRQGRLGFLAFAIPPRARVRVAQYSF